jgi:hypothetical protein
MRPLKKLTTRVPAAHLCLRQVQAVQAENTESTLVPAQVQAEFFLLILRVLCDLCGKNPFLQ